MGFKEKLLKQIIALGNKPLTVAEMQNKLNFRSSTERKIMASAVKELLRDGSLIDRGNGRIAPIPSEKLIKGELRGNKRGYAFLIREDSGPDLFVPNRMLGGAFHGDTVMARKTGESEGEVVSVVKRGKGRIVGTYIRSGNFGFVVPDDDGYFKDIFIPFDKAKNARPMSKVIVDFIIDPSNNKPVGEIVEILGLSGERNAEVLSILKGYSFEDKFPEEVLRAADEIEHSPELKNRKDYRELLTITIDGEDAKDFDDAISLERINNGYRLYVHIADVANYVRSGSVIDKEALKRGTSVYFPSSVFPMLPESISNGVCSLRPNEEKFTLTVVMDLDRQGNLIGRQFYESVIRSAYRMTYTDVTKILDGDKELSEKYSAIIGLLEDSKELASILTKKRNERGSINFITKESKIILNDKGDVEKIEPYPYEVSNGIIEQFMILANETVAEYISDLSYPCIYRVHETPSEAKLDAFKEFIRGLGYDFDTAKGVTPKLFSDLLEKIKGEPAEGIINKIMLRSMMKAKYTTANAGHFGLSLEYYCHFTSPIRRYPDLMVHRILKSIINNKLDEKFLSKFKSKCEDAAAISTEREISAEKAERDIDDYYKAVFMQKFIGSRFEGIVSGILSSGIFVALDNTVEGFVPASELPEDKYELDEKNYRLLGTKYSFSIGDKAEVEIKSSVIETRSVTMTLVSDVNNHLRKRNKGAKI